MSMVQTSFQKEGLALSLFLKVSYDAGWRLGALSSTRVTQRSALSRCNEQASLGGCVQGP